MFIINFFPSHPQYICYSKISKGTPVGNLIGTQTCQEKLLKSSCEKSIIGFVSAILDDVGFYYETSYSTSIACRGIFHWTGECTPEYIWNA